MSNTRTMLATLALGAAFAFAGPAFADKMKVTLDGKGEVPADTSAGKGTADLDYDRRQQEAELETDLFGALRPATMAHFHGPAAPGENAGVAVAIPNAELEPGRRQRHPDRRPGGRPDGRQVLHQRPHRGQSGRRNPRPGDEVSSQRANNKRGRTLQAPALFQFRSETEPQPFLRRKVSWQAPHSLPMPGKFAFSESRSLILALASVTALAKLATLAS